MLSTLEDNRLGGLLPAFGPNGPVGAPGGGVANSHILNSLPVPDPRAGDPVRHRVVEIAGRLAAVDERFSEWAAEVGVLAGSANDEAAKEDLICEVDACVALLYGLDEGDLSGICETFSETVDCSDHHAAVLGHFRRLRESA